MSSILRQDSRPRRSAIGTVLGTVLLVTTISADAGIALDFCPGDCNLDRRTSIGEIQKAILISLDRDDINNCYAIDVDDDGSAGVDELVAAVSAALGDCYAGTPRTFECPWPDLPDDDIHGFIMAGQSNMRGVGVPSELPEHLQTGDPRLLVYRRDRWSTLTPGLEWFGPEIGFAHALGEWCPNSRIGVLKLTRVNTGINSWLRDWNEELAQLVGNPNVGPLYPTLMDWVRASERFGTLSWEGFVWVHGASDKAHLDLSHEYGENMAALAEALRDDLGVADLPFIYQYRLRQPPPPPPDATTAIVYIPPGDEVVELEKWNALFEIPDAYAANWSRIATRDLVHLTSEGYLIGGRVMAEALMEGRRAQPASDGDTE